ncbi:cobW-domain-containing protein [Umbelopsis sp. PMI_123]|nr:cobW-domain-containing protein [Umbelopsis sp. PMI_123]
MAVGNPIPVTVFTGFLGSGKTTTILSLLKRLPAEYKLCLLKNEFGDTEVDSELARESNLGVQEMINGCMCCVLVGQMKLALMELKEKYNPDRIIVETSGSAFPAPIAWQIREMETDGFVLDSIATVVDCVNFTGYEDTSYTAKMQAQYTDVILLNKHELISERQLDTVIDHINELNTDTPKIKCEGTHGVSPDVLFGLDTKLFQISMDKTQRAEELMFTSVPGGAPAAHHAHGKHHENEVDLIQVCETLDTAKPLAFDQFEAFLKTLPKEDIYRLKGFVRLQEGDEQRLHIINHSFGRYTFTAVTAAETLEKASQYVIKITVMGQDLRMYVDKVRLGLGLDESTNIKFTAAHRH